MSMVEKVGFKNPLLDVANVRWGRGISQLLYVHMEV